MSILALYRYDDTLPTKKKAPLDWEASLLRLDRQRFVLENSELRDLAVFLRPAVLERDDRDFLSFNGYETLKIENSSLAGLLPECADGRTHTGLSDAFGLGFGLSHKICFEKPKLASRVALIARAKGVAVKGVCLSTLDGPPGRARRADNGKTRKAIKISTIAQLTLT